MLGEFELIARYFKPLAADSPAALGLVDDAAVLDGLGESGLVATADMVVAGVHFLADDPADQVARKLLRVNLSDLAAMGARPLGYLLTAAWPKDIAEPWIADFATGLAADQAEFGIALLGGDTTGTPTTLTLSLTALGTVPTGRALKRSTARAGDRVYVSGTIGDGVLGLDVLHGRHAELPAVDRDYAVDRYRLPQPRLALGQALSAQGLATAALDVSDGLVADLGHVAAASGLAARVEAAVVPLSPPARAVVESDPDVFARLVSGGDDYELLFAAAPDRDAEIAALAATLGLALTPIGTLEAGGPGVRLVDDRGGEIHLDQSGWTHF